MTQLVETLVSVYSQQQIDNVVALVKAGKTPAVTTAYTLAAQHARWALTHQPTPVKTFSVPGIYNTQGVQTPATTAAWYAVMNPFIADVDNAMLLALWWRLSGDPAYATACANILRAWYTTDTTVVNAQNNDAQLAMVDEGNGFITAAALLGNFDGWTDADRILFRRWVRTVYLPQAAIIIEDRTDNWGSIGLFGAIQGAQYLGDVGSAYAGDPTTVAAQAKLLSTHILSAINAADGTIPLELSRAGGRGIWYTYLSLVYICSAMQLMLNIDPSDAAQVGFQSKVIGARVNLALKKLQQLMASPGEMLLPGAADQWPFDLFEFAADAYPGDNFGTLVTQKQPIMYLGHHQSAATFSTLLCVGQTPTLAKAILTAATAK